MPRGRHLNHASQRQRRIDLDDELLNRIVSICWTISLPEDRDLTQGNRYRDPTAGVSPSRIGWRTTTWGAMVEMNFPLQQESRRTQERETEAKVSAARSLAEGLSLQLLGELTVNLAGSRGRTEHRGAGEDAVPSAIGAEPASALSAYERQGRVLDADRGDTP